MWFNYFRNIESKYRTQLSRKKPLVIRLDGKNITKNHKDYPLTDPEGFIYQLHRVAKQMVGGMKCHIYTSIDEVSFIFEDPNDFFSTYEDTDTLYVSAIFLQDFIKRFWKIYPEVKFGIWAFNINQDKVESYIKYRKAQCYNAAVFYFAKSNLSKDTYAYKTRDEVVQLLKDNGLYEQLERCPHLLNGLEDTIDCLELDDFLNLFN